MLESQSSASCPQKYFPCNFPFYIKQNNIKEKQYNSSLVALSDSPLILTVFVVSVRTEPSVGCCSCKSIPGWTVSNCSVGSPCSSCQVTRKLWLVRKKHMQTCRTLLRHHLGPSTTHTAHVQLPPWALIRLGTLAVRPHDIMLCSKLPHSPLQHLSQGWTRITFLPTYHNTQSRALD